jgi:hypothetical protein
MEKKITIGSVLGEGFQLGIKNAVSLLGCIILYVLTCWIPYINIGTTIAMACLPLEIAKGNIISPTAIFDKKYFKYMGEYFLISAFMFIGILVGLCMFLIPGYVIMIAWSLGILFLIDKGVNPMEALTLSNKATMGYKWTIFLSYLVLVIIGAIVNYIFAMIPFIGILLNIILGIVIYAYVLGMQAHIYSKLSE